MTKSRNIRCSQARKAAKAAGLKKYKTSIPCRRGHLSERLVSNGSCLECAAIGKKERDREYGRRNAEKARSRVRAWRAANTERVRERSRIRHLKNRDAELARMRTHWAANRESDRLRKKAIYWSDPESNKAKVREYYKNNPEKVKAYSRNRKARKRNAEGSHSGDDIQSLFTLQKGRCAWCSKSVKNGYHVDHIVALSRGGSNWPSNLQLLCASCNLRKRAKDPIQFAREEGRLL